MPLIFPPAPDLRPSDLSYLDAYNTIVSRVRRRGGGSSGGVVIFAGVDVDGLLAARILVSLFKQDDVPYRLVPINGVSELRTKRDELFPNGAGSVDSEVHTLILLSLGSLFDLAEEFQMPRGCHLHIIDAHRPWNLTNLYGIDVDADPNEEGGGRIWVWGDGEETKLDGVKKSWEALEYEPESDSDDSDEDEEESGDENEDEDEEEEEGEEGEEDQEEDEEGEDLEETEETDGQRSRRKRKQNGTTRPAKKPRPLEDDDRPRRLPRAVKDAHIDRVNKYYSSGTHYGMSVAQSVYLLATVLERADNDLLWLAILAVTHQYIASRIDRDTYEEHHQILLDEVVRLNPPPDTNGLGGSGGGERGKAPDPDDRSVSRSDELRFMLFRHWNLYDAMLHSSYVAGRMGIWREKGRKRLQGLLAKMGFSLQQCQQAYAHMDMNLRRDLPAKLDSIAPEYGLVELTYPSFTRAFGFQLASLSAADAVEGLSALLEAAKGVKLEVEIEGGRGGGEWFGGSRKWNVGSGGVSSRDAITAGSGGGGEEERRNGQEGAVGETQEPKKEQAWHVANFWIAYDACDDIVLLRKSLTLAMALHNAIIRQGSAILDKAIIRPLRTFRFASVREGPDLRLFCHPSTLSRLALWLVDATRDRWMEKDARGGVKVRSLPFVVACLNEEKGTFLVVGVTGAPDYGDVRKNKFGLAFQEAADISGVSYKLDMFDTSVVEVAASDLTSFVESLQLRSA